MSRASSLLRTFRNFEDSIGTSIIAVNSEATRAIVTTAANSPNTTAAMPPTNMIGANMHIVVSVEATTAVPTSLVPNIAPSVRPWPLSRCRLMLSTTTIALSTTIPTATARLASVLVLIVYPASLIMMNVIISDTGIDVQTIRLARKLRRKKSITRNTKSTAQNTVSRRFRTEAMMKSELSITILMPRSGGSVPASLSTSCLTLFATSTVFSPLCFWTMMPMPRCLLTLTSYVRSR